MKQTITILSLLLIISACGKKGGSASTYLAATQFVEDAEGLQTDLKNDFDQRDLADKLNGETHVTYLAFSAEGGRDRFRGFPFEKVYENISCFDLTVSTSPNSTVTKGSYYDCGVKTSTPFTWENMFNYYYSTYRLKSLSTLTTYSETPDLFDALNIPAEQIAIREVDYKGKTYAGFGIQVAAESDLSDAYKEFVLVPDLPKALNPVLVYESEGKVKALEGITVR